MQSELNAPVRETLMKKILCFSLFAVAAALVLTSGQTPPPSAEAHRLYIEDQKDRGWAASIPTFGAAGSPR